VLHVGHPAMGQVIYSPAALLPSPKRGSLLSVPNDWRHIRSLFEDNIIGGFYAFSNVFAGARAGHPQRSEWHTRIFSQYSPIRNLDHLKEEARLVVDLILIVWEGCARQF
jgi:hypothetical protein